MDDGWDLTIPVPGRGRDPHRVRLAASAGKMKKAGTILSPTTPAAPFLSQCWWWLCSVKSAVGVVAVWMPPAICCAWQFCLAYAFS